MAKVYLGETEIAPVVTAEVPEKRLNVGIDNIIGTVDENGKYIEPTTEFTPDLRNIKLIAYPNSLKELFKNNSLVVGDIIINITTINYSIALAQTFSGTNISSISFPELVSFGATSGPMSEICYNCRNLTKINFPKLKKMESGMNRGFYSCVSLESASFPALEEIDSTDAFYYAFAASGINSLSFPELITISGNSALNNMCSTCNKLKTIDIPKLKTINGSSVFGYAFNNCSSLESISFPSLEEILPLTSNSQFSQCFAQCQNLKEIHFPAAMEERVKGLTGYSTQFGATNATIYFDL